MDWYDRRIVEFVVRWAPFGGPPDDDLLPRFGLTRRQFAERFQYIVSTKVESTLADSDRDLLAEARNLLTTVRKAPTDSPFR